MNSVVTVASATVRLVFAAALIYATSAFPQTSDDAFPKKSITVYVADFDVTATSSPGPSRATANRAAPGASASLSANPAQAASAAAPSSGTTPASAATPASGSPDGSVASPATGSPDGRPDAAAKTDGSVADGTNISPSDAGNNTTTGTEAPSATAGANPTGTPPAGTPASGTQSTATPTNNVAGNNSATAGAAPWNATGTPAPVNRNTPGKPDPPSDDPRVRTAKFIDLTASTFVKALEHAGYIVKRLRSSGSAPEDGVVIRGVFAQVDASAGIRRAVYGGSVTDPNMLLFVGVGNLAKPQQTLYQVVTPAPSGTLGPVIAVSAYAPVSRYELEHEPSEDSLRRIAEQFSDDLTRLLNANPLAFGQP
jgi:hypothetical protein